MKIKILNADKEIEIELTDLQFKAIQLTDQPPEDYVAYKLERILDFAVNQARQTIDRISPMDSGEMENLLDKIKAEKEKESD